MASKRREALAGDKLIPKGKVAEYRFAAAVMDKGLLVSWPSSDTWPYDCIVDSGSVRYRVQVKSTEKVADNTSSSICVTLSTNGKPKRRYLKKDTDFIVLYLFEHDVWYIFPVQDVTTSVTLNPLRSSCKYRKYMDAWGLFSERRAKRGGRK